MWSSPGRTKATSQSTPSTAARPVCPAIEAAIDADQWKVIAWFPQVKVRVLTADELKQFDPDGLAFWNVNTPDEFLQAEQLAQTKP